MKIQKSSFKTPSIISYLYDQLRKKKEVITMDLKLSGRVHKILDEKTGEGKNGPWRKRDFILETKGKFPKKVCITQWGDNIDKQAVQEDEEVTVYIDIQSREYKGNWYTDVKAWKIEQGSGDVEAPPSAPGLTMEGNQEIDYDEDDVPF